MQFGEELWTRFLPKLLQILGAGVVTIGLVGTVRDALDSLYQYPGGLIADRVGTTRAFVLFTGMAICGYAVLAVASSWQAVVLALFLVMAWSTLASPAIFALIAESVAPGGRAMAFAVQSLVKRVPIVVAPALGGWLIVRAGLSLGMRIAFGLSIGVGLVALAAQALAYQPAERVSSASSTVRMSAQLKRLLIADTLVRIGEGIPEFFIVLYVLDTLHAGPVQFGVLVGLQMATSLAIYLPVARLADRTGRRPWIVATFAAFALFPLTLALTSAPAWLPLAFVVGGLKELGEPARKALIADLAPAAHRGRTVGSYYLVRNLFVIPTSFVGGLLFRQDPHWPFLAGGLIAALGCAVFVLERQRR